MKIIFPIITLLLPIAKVFAHEEGTEATDLTKADWLGPIIAVAIIAGAIIIARIIRKRSGRKIINGNQT
ncbi:MAG: hypothetical protein HZA25_02165 [Candidatus Niyogibacteria bacterium]|nr:hypothetical protein [Candidatus Niyogibacteria bacterium]